MTPVVKCMCEAFSKGKHGAYHVLSLNTSGLLEDVTFPLCGCILYSENVKRRAHVIPCKWFSSGVHEQGRNVGEDATSHRAGTEKKETERHPPLCVTSA